MTRVAIDLFKDSRQVTSAPNSQVPDPVTIKAEDTDSTVENDPPRKFKNQGRATVAAGRGGFELFWDTRQVHSAPRSQAGSIPSSPEKPAGVKSLAIGKKLIMAQSEAYLPDIDDEYKHNGRLAKAQSKINNDSQPRTPSGRPAVSADDDMASASSSHTARKETPVRSGCGNTFGCGSA